MAKWWLICTYHDKWRPVHLNKRHRRKLLISSSVWVVFSKCLSKFRPSFVQILSKFCPIIFLRGQSLIPKRILYPEKCAFGGSFLCISLCYMFGIMTLETEKKVWPGNRTLDLLLTGRRCYYYIHRSDSCNLSKIPLTLLCLLWECYALPSLKAILVWNNSRCLSRQAEKRKLVCKCFLSTQHRVNRTGCSTRCFWLEKNWSANLFWVPNTVSTQQVAPPNVFD